MKPLPGDFPSVDAYIAAFEPFVFAECRAELRQEWQEVCDGSKNHYEVIVTGVEEYEPGKSPKNFICGICRKCRRCGGFQSEQKQVCGPVMSEDMSWSLKAGDARKLACLVVMHLTLAQQTERRST